MIFSKDKQSRTRKYFTITLFSFFIFFPLITIFQNCSTAKDESTTSEVPANSAEVSEGFGLSLTSQRNPAGGLADSSLIVGTFYFPGWGASEKADANGANQPWGWELLKNFPDRKPLQGYYNDGAPGDPIALKNAALQIKNARDNGINLFVFDWYRRATKNSDIVEPALGNALEHGFLKVNQISTGMKFAVLFPFDIGTNTTKMILLSPADKKNLEQTNDAQVRSRLIQLASDQLAYRLYPYWKENYFRRGDYQRIQGRPLLFFLGFRAMLSNFGFRHGANLDDVNETREPVRLLSLAFANLKNQAQKSADQPPMIGCSMDDFVDPTNTGDETILRQRYDLLLQAGCDFHYEYGNSSTHQRPSAAISKMYRGFVERGLPDRALSEITSYERSGNWSAFNSAFGAYAQAKNWDYLSRWNTQLPSVATLSVGWEDTPWNPNQKLLSGAPQFYYSLSPSPMRADMADEPTSYYGLLSYFAGRTKTDSKFSQIGDRRLLLIGSWNEYGEGHVIEPTVKHRFGYLEPIRYLLRKAEERSSFVPNVQEILYPDVVSPVQKPPAKTPPIAAPPVAAPPVAAPPAQAPAPIVTPPKSQSSLVAIYRFFRASNQKHFYSTSKNEGLAKGYVYEGIGFRLQSKGVAGTAPLYRCWSNTMGKYFVYRDSKCGGFKRESIYGYISINPAKGKHALFQMYNPKTQDHLATFAEEEGLRNGYHREYILGYADR